MDAHKNFAYSTVATAPSPASSGLSLVVAAGDGAKFPAAPFNATVWPTGVQPTTSNAEIVRVTGIATDTLTIIRQQESTSARSIIVGDQIANAVTIKVLTDIEGMFSPSIAMSNLVTYADQTIPALMGAYVPSDLEIGGISYPGDGGLGGNALWDAAPAARAMSFLAPVSGTIVSVGSMFEDAGSPSDQIKIALRNDNSGAPAASDIDSVTITPVASGGLTPKAASGAISGAVVEGSRYWLVFNRTGATDHTNYWVLSEDDNSNQYSGGSQKSTSDGSTWGVSTFDVPFFAIINSVLELAADAVLEIG